MSTHRILLDKLRSHDADPLVALHTSNDVRRFLGGALSLVEAEARAAEEIASEHPTTWAIRYGADTTLMGVISLTEHHDGDDVEVSFLLLPAHQGHGVASAALQEVLRIAFSERGLRRVVAETQSKNERSVRLSERNGFKLGRRLIRYGEQQSIYVATENEYSR